MTKVNSLKIFTDSASLLKKMYKAGKSTVGDLHSLNDGPEGTIKHNEIEICTFLVLQCTFDILYVTMERAATAEGVKFLKFTSINTMLRTR